MPDGLKASRLSALELDFKSLKSTLTPMKSRWRIQVKKQAKYRSKNGATADQLKAIAFEFPDLVPPSGKVDFITGDGDPRIEALISFLRSIGLRIPPTAGANDRSDIRISRWLEPTNSEADSALFFIPAPKHQLATVARHDGGVPLLSSKHLSRSSGKRDFGCLDFGGGLLAVRDSILPNFEDLDLTGIGFKSIASDADSRSSSTGISTVWPTLVMPPMHVEFCNDDGNEIPPAVTPAQTDSGCYTFVGYFSNVYRYRSEGLAELEPWDIARTYERLGNKGCLMPSMIVSRQGRKKIDQLKLSIDWLPQGFELP